MTDRADKKTIGLDERSRVAIAQVMETGLFRDQLDVAMIAMVLAIRCGCVPGEAEGTDTTWNRGSFDPDVLPLLKVVFPDVAMPFRAIEYFINEGLHRIGEESMCAGGTSLEALLIGHAEGN